MKRVIIIFFIGIFLLFLSKYFFDNLSPFNLKALNDLIVARQIKPNDWEELNKQILLSVRNGSILNYLSANAYIGIIILLSSTVSFFIFIHLIFDKIFFKNFYEKASVINAIRRGIFLFIGLGLLIYLKFYGVDRTLLLAEPLLFIVLEILFSLHIDKFINVRINKLIEFLKKLNEDNEKVKKK